MKEAAEFFNKFKAGLLGGLYTGALATVEAYDPAGTADITVLPDGDLVQKVPVATLQGGGFFIRAPLTAGDLVVVLFAQRAIDGIMHGDTEPDKSERTHDVNDAIIVGGLNLFAEPLPAADADKLVMGNKSGPGKITIAPDGTITLTGKTKTESW